MPTAAPSRWDVTSASVDLEAAGWDGLFVYDHVHLDPAGGLEIYDPWVLLAAVARATSRIRLATAVTPISRRRPWQLAREIVALDHLSGGRVSVGIGLGGLDQFEFEPFGEIASPRERAPVTDEALTLLDRFLRGKPVDHAGEHFQVQAHLRPAAVQQPRPPIWIAATHPYRKGLERASRWDGVFCNLKIEQDHSALTPAELQSYLGDLLERPDFDVVTFSHPEHPDSAYEEVGVTWLVEPSSVTDWLEAARERFL